MLYAVDTHVVVVILILCFLWPASGIIKIVCMLKHKFYGYSFNILQCNVLTKHSELYLFAYFSHSLAFHFISLVFSLHIDYLSGAAM